jgi:hypothetical protein
MRNKKLIKADALGNMKQWPTQADGGLRHAVHCLQEFVEENINLSAKVKLLVDYRDESAIEIEVPTTVTMDLGDGNGAIMVTGGTVSYLIDPTGDITAQITEVVAKNKLVQDKAEAGRWAQGRRDMLREAGVSEEKIS